jgi:hypothetical protein
MVGMAGVGASMEVADGGPATGAIFSSPATDGNKVVPVGAGMKVVGVGVSLVEDGVGVGEGCVVFPAGDAKGGRHSVGVPEQMNV